MNAYALHALPDRAGVVRWSGSAAVIVALHAAVIAAGLAWYSQPPLPGSAEPIILVVMAPQSSSPESQRLDVAPGPQMQESDPPPPPPPPPPEQATRQPEQDIPATPPQDRPVVEVQPEQTQVPLKSEPAKENSEQSKPVPVKPRPVHVEAAKPSEKPAPRTSAAPKAEQRSAALTSTVDGAAAAAASASYRSLLSAHLQRFKQYPAGARAAGEQGTSMLSFTVGRNGRVLASRLARSSGHASLDAETLDLIRRAQPLPPFPPEMKQASMSYTMAIPFSLR
jgi:protein TonB